MSDNVLNPNKDKTKKVQRQKKFLICFLNAKKEAQNIRIVIFKFDHM